MVCPGADSDDKHPETDVQDIDVSLIFSIFTSYLLIKSTRKKAGALHLGDGLTRSGAGMSTSMRERAKQALTGHTGETDDEDE